MEPVPRRTGGLRENLPVSAAALPLTLADEASVSPDLDVRIRQLLCICFPPDADVFSATRYWHGCAPAFVLVREQNRRVEGHMAIVIRAVRCGDREIRVAGVQGFAVHPDQRGSGLGARLMELAMAEARRRGIDFGLLFCVPDLEQYYRRLGWSSVREAVFVADENGARVPMPGKNIGMTRSLGPEPFPGGTIDLLGRDW